jgi:hypothetical protein
MTIQGEKVSTFALIVDKLRKLDEAELKLAYIRFFKEDLVKEWEEITSRLNFGDITDEEIVERMERMRYGDKS